MITGAQIRAARAMVRWSPMELAAKAKVPIEPIRRAERSDGEATLMSEHESAIKAALEAAGVRLLDDNGSGAGVRLRLRTGPADEGLRPDQLTSENDG
jgi:hypothetical protein